MILRPTTELFRGWISLCLLASMLFASGLANASTATQQTEISISKGDTVQISGVDDWLIGVFSAIDTINTSQINWDNECVYSSTGAYSIEVTSGNGGGQLNLQSTAGDSMAYRIYVIWRQAGGGYRFGSTVSSTFNITNMGGSSSLTCADEFIIGTNLWFGALVTPAAFNPAPPGIYQDFVTLSVRPE